MMSTTSETPTLREEAMHILGAKLPTFMIGRKSTSWQFKDLTEDEYDRFRWMWRVIVSFKAGPYPWDDVTLRTWFMGMNPRLGGDDYNNPATLIRDGLGEKVLQAAKGDYFDGSMGA
jgi:hypothetical protein